MNPYIQDILAQPKALKSALDQFDADLLVPLQQNLARRAFDRILITGMGASFNAAYPAYLHLTKLGLPVMLVNAAELLHYAADLVSSQSLLWLNSQSGRSIELVRLLERIQANPPGAILASVNDISSPLATAADVCLPIYAGEESTVSTRTYINMLAVNLLAAIVLKDGDMHDAKEKMLLAASKMQQYLSDWQAVVAELDSRLGTVKDMFFLGRGASLAAVWNGSLINKEAAKSAFEGMNSADFRHGPLELVSPDLTVMVLEGAPQTANLNRDLALEIDRLGGRVFWLAQQDDPALETVLLPVVDEVALPLVEILPLQMLTILMAQRKGYEAGKFRHVQKVTMRE